MLIQTAVEEYLNRHAGEEFTSAPTPKPESNNPPASLITADQRRLLDAVSKLSPQAQRQLLKFIDSLA